MVMKEGGAWAPKHPPGYATDKGLLKTNYLFRLKLKNNSVPPMYSMYLESTDVQQHFYVHHNCDEWACLFVTLSQRNYFLRSEKKVGSHYLVPLAKNHFILSVFIFWERVLSILVLFFDLFESFNVMKQGFIWPN